MTNYKLFVFLPETIKSMAVRSQWRFKFITEQFWYRLLCSEFVDPDNNQDQSIASWRRYIRCLMLQGSFRKRATNYRVFLRKMTLKNEALNRSLSPCNLDHGDFEVMTTLFACLCNFPAFCWQSVLQYKTERQVHFLRVVRSGKMERPSHTFWQLGSSEKVSVWINDSLQN